VTVDFETLDDNAVTVRERDSMQQERISLDGISAYFAERLLGS
jgi:glycyl-tRNA synthetase